MTNKDKYKSDSLIEPESSKMRTLINQVQQPEELNEEEIMGFKEAFMLFDKEGNGKIELKELGIVMRSVGVNISEKDLKF